MTHTPSHRSKWQRAAFVLLLGSMVQTAFAAVINVSAQDNLNDALARAQAGDTLKLASGTYKTKLYIDKPITIEGPTDRSAKIIGDSALIEHNNVLDNSVGVYIHGAAESMVRENKIVGEATLRVNERGNGVTVWNAPGAQVVDNDISKGRDGIFSNTSTNNTYKGNRFSDLRFAVHYMYTNDSEVSNNISVGNNMGYVLMFSERLKVYGNIAVGSRDQGIMLNYVNYSDINDNIINKAGKCVFAYNADFNKIFDNHFENCQIGIHFTAAIEGTSLFNNSFINNESQVKYVSTRFLDWGEGGRGNYWSDNSAFDLDGDGFGDNAYRPNGIIDQIIWRAPVSRLLMNSPAVSIVKWAQSQFPAILPGGVIDSKPLMKPISNKTSTKYEAMKDELLHEANTRQSNWSNAENGSLN